MSRVTNVFRLRLENLQELTCRILEKGLRQIFFQGDAMSKASSLRELITSYIIEVLHLPSECEHEILNKVRYTAVSYSVFLGNPALAEAHVLALSI